MRLFDWLKKGIKGFIDAVKKPEPTIIIGDNFDHIKEQEKIYAIKEKYKPLMELANTKYSTIEQMQLGEYSIAYQNAGRDFNIDDITDKESLFREIARAQTFVNEPTSNIEVVKKYVNDIGKELYVGRGNGEDDLKAFWKAVNYAKEDPSIKGDLALKRYSGAFEYAYKVWREGNKYVGPDEVETVDIKDAIQDFLKKEKETFAKNITTPNELKYEMPDDELEDEKFDF